MPGFDLKPSEPSSSRHFARAFLRGRVPPSTIVRLHASADAFSLRLPRFLAPCWGRRQFSTPTSTSPTPSPTPPQKQANDSSEREQSPATTKRENIYTVPNLLTIVHATFRLQHSFSLMQGRLTGSNVTVQRSVLGTILDPAADKTLVTTLTSSSSDATSALNFCFYTYRYISLPTTPPSKTFKRYWDFSIPSAEVRPTQISKVSDALQGCRAKLILSYRSIQLCNCFLWG
ncbi:hypothetical protein BKA62DRAFT_737647 [Auriculariales sp. MPI-PUGE-AT-0066]|nr:hypothetical protein BKA62DRAFT_737647 [Auriculariales sp. MPI-PUGE-AT-0066]